MREKMLGISRRIRSLAAEPGIHNITPQELLQELADIIDEELDGNKPEVAPLSIGARSMGLDTIKNQQ